MQCDQERTALKRLLDLAQEIQQVSETLAGGTSPSQHRRLRAHHRGLLKTLGKLLSGGPKSTGLPTVFREVRARHGLKTRELLLLLFLLERRIADSDVMEGRELLQLLSERSFDLLQNARLLHADSPLLESGLVRMQLPHPETTLEGEFRIAERFYRYVYRGFHDHKTLTSAESDAAPPYGSPVDHYLDLRRLVALHQRRAALLFPQSYWVDLHTEASERLDNLDESIARTREDIGRREENTDDKRMLPVLTLRREFGLDDDEEVIILTLLFQELFASSPVIEAAELLRLVSGTEAQMFGNRRLLTAGGRLVDSGLVSLDVELEEKELLAGVYLPEWVTQRLLQQIDSPARIRTDDRRRFHDYLEGLEGSEDFYRNL